MYIVADANLCRLDKFIVHCQQMILKICVCFLPSLLTGRHHEIDVQKTIQLVRAQRSGMVQTEVRVAHNSEVIIAVLS